MFNFEKLSAALEAYKTRRPNPCDTCPLADTCADNDTDCFAFRRWSNEGNYKDRQVGHLIRAFELWD